MKKTGVLLLVLFGLGLYPFVGQQVYAYNDLNHVTVAVEPMSATNVQVEQDVLFQVTMTNKYESPARVDLWFTVDLSGLDTEKQVTTPYLSQESPISGVIGGRQEVVLELKARALQDIQAGPYTFYTKVGNYTTNSVIAKDRFSGTIVLQVPRDSNAPVDEWVLSSVRAVNEAGKEFLASGVKTARKTVDMLQNYPNPFNPSTNLTYEVKPGEALSAPVSLSIYNIRGQLIRTLVDERQTTGMYTIKWDGNDSRGVRAESGLYLFKLQSGSDVSYRKGVLTR